MSRDMTKEAAASTTSRHASFKFCARPASETGATFSNLGLLLPRTPAPLPMRFMVSQTSVTQQVHERIVRLHFEYRPSTVYHCMHS